MEGPSADASLEGFGLDSNIDEGNNNSGFLNPGDQVPLNQGVGTYQFPLNQGVGTYQFPLNQGIDNSGFLNHEDQFPLNQGVHTYQFPLNQGIDNSSFFNHGDQFLLNRVEVVGSQFERGESSKKATDTQIQMSQSHNISENMVIMQSIQSTRARGLNAPANDRRLRKKMIDQKYRAKRKEKLTKLQLELEEAKRKIEELESKSTDQINYVEECENMEELKTVRVENTKLRSELEAANQKIEEFESKSTDQINYVEECRIVFELDFPDEASQRKLMKKTAGYRGIASIKMDTQRKRMFLEGIDIDPVRLKCKLDKICNTKMVYFNTDRKAEIKKADNAVEDVNFHQDDADEIVNSYEDDDPNL